MAINKSEKDVMLKKWEGVSFEEINDFKIRVNKVGFKYFLFGYEICPTTNRKHIQWYGETYKKIRLSSIGNKKHLNCTVYPLRRPVREAIRYIIDNPDKPNPVYEELGSRPSEYEVTSPVGSNLTQAAARKAVSLEILSLARLGKFDIIADKYPGQYLRSYQVLKKIYADSMPKPVKDNIQCILVRGKSGSGKTQFLKQHFQTDDVYWYNKNPNFYEKYDCEQVLVIDDLDKSHRHLLNHLKTTCDTVPNLLNVKFGSVWSNVRKILITTQYSWGKLIGRDERGNCIDPELEEALTRRFTTFDIRSRDEVNNDLFVYDSTITELFPLSLRNYLLAINFI
jgi:hypothetical protein